MLALRESRFECALELRVGKGLLPLAGSCNRLQPLDAPSTAESRAELAGRYRELMLSVLFTGEGGLRIIGEIQLHGTPVVLAYCMLVRLVLY